MLDAVARNHDAESALTACRRIVDDGFILNIDLVYGLPVQDEKAFAHDFEQAVQCGVHAFTCYNLRLNEHTPVARKLAPAERFDLGRLIALARIY